MSETPQPSRRLAFIVPAHNEETLLGATLDALHRSAGSLGLAYEVIVVDDGSTDETSSVARAHGARVLRTDDRQIARARNLGAGATSRSRLVFVDADTVVPAETLRATVEALDRGAVGGGALLRLDAAVPFPGSLGLWLLRALMRWGRLAAGSYLFCTRSAFEAAGGFDERLFVTEELSLSRALRRQGRFVVLRQEVVTSGRKLRTHSARELVSPFLRFLLSRGRVVRSREHLDLWYGTRRVEPPASGGRTEQRSTEITHHRPEPPRPD